MNKTTLAIQIKNRIVGATWLLPYDLRRQMFQRTRPAMAAAYADMRRYEMGELPGLKVSLKRQDELKCIFIHIPKCAGISIGRGLFGESYAGNHMGVTSYQMIYSKEEFGSFYKFTFVRNPWDRIVSAFHFLKEYGKGGIRPGTSTEQVARYADFQTFVKDFLTPSNARRWEHFRPQHHFVCTPNGKLMVDYVARYEKIADEFTYICEQLNIDSQLVHHNRTGGERKPFQSYYDAETQEIVTRVYQRDIELFNYQFSE